MAYLGNAPGVESQRLTTSFTATAAQTAFNPVGGYTLGYVDVYLNGVKLIDGTDFTADDGVTVTLSSGASAGDAVELVCYTPRGLSDGYTKSEADAKYTTVSDFESTGIDDNATSTAITIDSSGNLLVGKTSADGGVNGGEIRANGEVYFTATSAQPLALNRKSTDGNILNFAKDGSTVGSIATDSGNILQVNSGGNDKGVFLSRNGANVVGFAPNEANVFRPASLDTVDLGKSDRRFKDLYLSGEAKASKVTLDDSNGGDLIIKKNGTSSAFIGEQSAGLGSGDGLLIYTYNSGTIRFYPEAGSVATMDSDGLKMETGKGVYLGGTGAANKLDDYEEGTWTPRLEQSSTNPSVTYSSQSGTYTKVGRMVYVSGHIAWSSQSGGGGSFKIAGLPFNVLNSSGAYPQLLCTDYGGIPFLNANDTTLGGYGVLANSAILLLTGRNDGSNSASISTFDSSGFMYFNLTYQE